MTLISLDKAIRTIMGFGDIPQSNGLAYSRLQRILSATMGELQLNVFPKILSVIATTSPDLTLEIPVDCAKVYKVGRLFDDGTIRTLGRIKTYKETETSCDCPGCQGAAVGGQTSQEAVATVDAYCSACTFHNFYFTSGYGELYASQNDHFENGKWSHEDGIIKLHSGCDVAIDQKMVIEYESAFNEESLNLIEFDNLDMLRNKCLYEFYRNSRPGISQMYWSDFKRALANRKRRITNMPTEEIVAAISGYRNSP